MNSQNIREIINNLQDIQLRLLSLQHDTEIDIDNLKHEIFAIEYDNLCYQTIDSNTGKKNCNDCIVKELTFFDCKSNKGAFSQEALEMAQNIDQLKEALNERIEYFSQVEL